MADSESWSEERERKGMGYSESISAHVAITTTENSGHDAHSKYNEQSRTRAFFLFYRPFFFGFFESRVFIEN